MRNKAGFTLIELVIVIVILGILAAAAIPRFSDLSTDARISAVNGIAGALRSAASIAHSTQLVRGYSSGSTISLEGTNINMSRGYPVASNISIALADPVLAGFTASAISPGQGGNIVYFTITGRSEGTCTVMYKDPRADAEAGFTVSAVTTGC